MKRVWLPGISWIALSLGLTLGLAPAWPQTPKLVDQVWSLVEQEFVDPAFNPAQWEDQRQQLLGRGLEDERQLYGAIQAALQSLEDPYTRLIDPRLAQPQEQFVGVGLYLGVDRQTGYLVAIAPLDTSPASQAGLLPGDLITAIDGVDTQGMEVDEAILRISGQRGTPVTLSLLQRGTPVTLRIQRDAVTLDPVTHRVHSWGDRSLGYIRLAYFTETVADQVRRSIQVLESQGVEGYVLDLRANPGGLVESSVAVAQMWLDRGTIVTLKDRQGRGERLMAGGSAVTDHPLVVLVDQGTASASEILAAALQDHQRALLVGSATFGKGSVQSLHSLSGGAGLAITTAHYLTPQGYPIDDQGIEPDIQVDLTLGQAQRLAQDRDQVATAADPHFKAAAQALSSGSWLAHSP